MGLCDAFDRYNEYLAIYESVLKANILAKENRLEDMNHYNEELRNSDKLKVKYDKILTEEIAILIDIYMNTYSELVDEFKLLLKSINNQVIIYFNIP